MKILVAGGAGFIGSNFVRHILENYPDYKVVNYDKLTYAGNLDNLRDVESNSNYTFVQGDICDVECVDKVISEHGIDTLINFAAETHVDRSIHIGSRDFVMTNVIGVQTLLDAARRHNLQKMVNISTDEVYGTLDLGDGKKFFEDTAFTPNVPYAAAKAGGDLMCRAYFKTFKVPVIVSHCSNNYGPYQFPEKLIPFAIFKAMNNEPVPIYGDGLYVRDWIFVMDHCRAIDWMLHEGVPGEVYNIGADNERHNVDVVKMILRMLNKPEDLTVTVQDRPGHDRRYAVDATKIQRELKWKPEYTVDKFEQGLSLTVEWYRQNMEWVEKLRKRQTELNSHIKPS
ncbi:MAG: dTDP-glucose 4,6-dehydratase [Patescibacteria group bacterium]|nr:dTDP-glucose 4,6-dehydratase [Patescibacteria group bacterium]